MIERKVRNARHKAGIWRAAARDAARFAVNRDRREIARRRFFELATEITPVFAVDADGMRYFVHSADKGDISRSLFFHGGYDRDLLEQVDGLLAGRTGRGLQGRAFLDVGANIGTASLAALRYHDASHAVAVEPDPRNFRLLRMNLIANDLEPRATAVEAAVTAQDGEVELEMADRNLGDNRVRATPEAGEPGRYGEERRQVVKVPARRLDDIVAAAGIAPADVAVAWVDTQGHEGQVLAGAPELLAARVPFLLEYWPYGLRRARGLDLLHGLIAEHYGTVLDLGRHEGPGAAAPETVADVAALPQRYPETFTNLLLLP